MYEGLKFSMFLCIRVGFLGFVAGATGEFSICSSKFCWVGNLDIFSTGDRKCGSSLFLKGWMGGILSILQGLLSIFCKGRKSRYFFERDEFSVYLQGEGGSRYSCNWRKNSRYSCSGRKISRHLCKGRAEFSVFLQSGKFPVFCQRGGGHAR